MTMPLSHETDPSIIGANNLVSARRLAVPRCLRAGGGLNFLGEPVGFAALVLLQAAYDCVPPRRCYAGAPLPYSEEIAGSPRKPLLRCRRRSWTAWYQRSAGVSCRPTGLTPRNSLSTRPLGHGPPTLRQPGSQLLDTPRASRYTQSVAPSQLERRIR